MPGQELAMSLHQYLPVLKAHAQVSCQITSKRSRDYKIVGKEGQEAASKTDITKKTFSKNVEGYMGMAVPKPQKVYV